MLDLRKGINKLGWTRGAYSDTRPITYTSGFKEFVIAGISLGVDEMQRSCSRKSKNSSYTLFDRELEGRVAGSNGDNEAYSQNLETSGRPRESRTWK